MTRIEFEQQMERLKSTYTKSKYPPERESIFWAKFSAVNGEDFKRVVSKLIAREAYAPMFDKFSELLDSGSVISRRQAIIDRQSSIQSCSRCGNTGAYTVMEKDKLSYRWQCDCPLGAIAYPNFPRRVKSPDNSKNIKFDSEISR